MTQIYENYRTLPIDFSKSHLLLDMDALDSNINYVNKLCTKKLVRIATKSLRSIPVMNYVLSKLQRPYGLMAYTTEEALWLRSKGFKNILVGYPKWDKESIKSLSQNSSNIILMVDCVEHLTYLAQHASTNQPFSICLDIDLSLDLPGLRFGVFRSPIQTLEKLKRFIETLKELPQLKLIGLMGYEAQVAGIADKHSFLIQFLKFLSISSLRKRRLELASFLNDSGISLQLINGGGSGSMTSTTQEDIVTEITIGSAFYAPTLFDNYKDVTFTPSLFYSLPIIRQPAPNIYTCFGGGYNASGSIELSKAPLPYLPQGITLLKHEGAGEVQTPFKTDYPLNIFDPVFFRYAKAGEVCERFNEIDAFRGKNIENTFLTYRGEGKVFI